MRTAKQLLLSLALLVGLMTPQVAAQCEDSYWPIYAGGAKGNEEVRCFVYDPQTQLIIVGGTTTSEDFAPAPNEHGYMFALDLSGNWKWGSFFYNVSYAVSSVDGCQLSSDGTTLAVAGMGNSQPLLMDINTVDGSFNKFISLDYIDATTENVPAYIQYGAIYYDVRDYRDYQPYFYGAFVKDDAMFMLRVADGGASPTVDWNFQFVNYSDAEELVQPLLNMKEPNFIIPDPKQQSALYMIGRYRGKGSVIRFNKRDGSIRWHAQFEEMSSIKSVSQASGDDDLFLCGHYQPNEGGSDSTTEDSTINYRAVMARMKDDGDVSWIITATGKHPLYSANTYEDQDKCLGISYYKEKEQLAVVIQGKMTEIRGTNKGDWYDTILLLMKSGGETDKVVSISQGNLEYDMYGAKNGVFWVGDDIFFAGKSYGFKTNNQELVKETDSLDYDAYIYKYRFGWENRCLTLYEGKKSSMKNNMDAKYEDSEVKAQGLYTFTTTYRSIPMNKEDNYFIPYPSRYSGGFTLLDTMKIPRPCAHASQNFTSVQYYRGQNTLQYNIYSENSAKAATYITGTPYIIFQDGKDAAALATFNQQQNTIDIQTDADEMVGIQKTIIRSCDQLDRLLEMNLYIEVISNTYPDFVTEPETAFTVAVNDVYQYQLPAVTDPEGNDEPEVYVGYMDQQQDKFPDFLLFNNATNTITLKPDSKIYAGRTYYFTIVVKEKNSDSVKYSFYATVRVEGEINDPEGGQYLIGDRDEDGITQVNYTIEYVDDKGHGSLKFTSPIHMKWLEENFHDFFNVYWRDTTYRKTKQDLSLLDFEPTIFSEDAMTVNFTLKFSKPYRIGLLVKKSDRLHIDVKMNETDYSGTYGLWLGKADTYKLGNDADKQRLEMIFDFDNEVMSTFRNIAKNMYWVLIAIIVVQFIVLSIRGVGLLPVWVFIEYLQLVGFMPIYNFRLIPYLYDAFKPSLVAHMIIFDDTPFIEDLDKEYFNKNYENYWLSVGKLFQSFFFVCLFLAILILANIVVFAIHKCNCSNNALGTWASKKMTQFKFNAYIRYYMLVYFDTTFFSVMKIMDPNNDTVARKAALLLSYVLFVVNIVLPVFLIAHINRRFDILAMKEAKQSFNSLLLKIDKASRWRIMNPAYFFARRLLTAMLLTLPIENTFIFLQYVFILMSSHAYILYMVAVKPYQTPGINSYVLASETFYSALIIAIFIFSDATPEMSIKFGAGVALIVSLILLVLSNLIMNVYYLWQGPAKIKKTIKEATLKRAEKEALERAEEEERKLKKKKEEEEFTKIPDETMNMSSIDQSNTTQQNNTMSELNNPKKRGKNKKKGLEDNVVDGGTMGGDDFQPTKKRRRNKDKDKNKQDDLAEGTITGTGPVKSKKRKNKKTEDGDPTTTVNQQTDFGTTNPATTKGDLL